MNTERPEWEIRAMEREAALDAQLQDMIEEICHLALQRHGRMYAPEFLAGMIESTLPRIPNDPNPKRPIPQRLRTQVFERDGYRCVMCGGWSGLSADHIMPESKGGEATFDNLQTLCRSCNSKKGNRI